MSTPLVHVFNMLLQEGGEFNLPDIDWDLLNTNSGGVAPDLSKQLINNSK